MSNFADRLAAKVRDYILLRRSLGHAFEVQAATLEAFHRFVARQDDSGPLTGDLALAFVLACDVTPNVRARRHAVLRRFAEYLTIFEPTTEVLDPQALPRSRTTPPARILDDAELARLLAAALEVTACDSMRGRTLYTLVGLLASTGLRSGEALRLDRTDVDLARGVLEIRRTKFRKDRLVPVHSTTCAQLQAYAAERNRTFPRAKSPAFFLSLRGGRLSCTGLGNAFRQARARAGLDGDHPRQLRPHDLRHRFAITRLVTSYRAGVDVQAQLPLLATYLGHVRYSDTAYYITGTAELLGLAAERVFALKGGYAMKSPPTLAGLLESFFRRRLVEQRNASPATIESYRDALRLLVRYVAERTKREPCALTVMDFDRDIILDFLEQLERVRGNRAQTRNARLTAIRSFFRHVAASDPGSLGIAQRVLAIPTKRTASAPPRHLAEDELAALLNASDSLTVQGRRDYALLLFLARTGARVSEAVGIDAADLRLEPPQQVLLRGKGRKQRHVPLAADLTQTLRALCRERGLGADERRPVFIGEAGERLTRFGVTHLVRRAVERATVDAPSLARTRVSPHLFRHTLAMQLLRARTDLVTIQAWLGHAQVATTHRYAEADIEMMRKSLKDADVTGGGADRYQPTDDVLQILENQRQCGGSFYGDRSESVGPPARHHPRHITNHDT